MNLQLSSQWFGRNFSQRARRLAVSSGIPALLAAVVLSAAIPAGAQTAQTSSRTQLSASTESDNGVAKMVFTATVSDPTGNSLSDGSVSFMTAKGSIGSAFVQDGVATLSVSRLPQGVSSVTAVYNGDTTHGASSSSTQVTTNAASSALPTFTVTASTTSPAAVTPGEYTTVVLTVASQNSFSQAVNLSCSGLPQHSTCSFTPTSVTPPANGAVTSTMQITTEANSGALHDLPGFGSRSGIAYAILIPGILALAGVGALRKKNFAGMRILGIVLLLGAGILGTSGCSARYKYFNRPPEANGSTPAGTYTIVVAAYSSNGTSVQNATPLNITLTVK
jgi:hypothetical protein